MDQQTKPHTRKIQMAGRVWRFQLREEKNTEHCKLYRKPGINPPAYFLPRRIQEPSHRK